MNTQRLWDIFCTVIDNHGDLGVCWRLASQLQAAGQRVRLWVDDASALAWMAPQAKHTAGVTVLPWADANNPSLLAALPRADVWIEAFGCTLPEAFVAHGVARTGAGAPPLWINLEYLSAEDWVARMHGLPSPVMSGPAKGWTKQFVYPGFTPDTGGLLREIDLLKHQQDFDRAAWRATHAPGLAKHARLISLFCYEPPALPDLLRQLANTDHHLLVTPGRPMAAVQQAVPKLPKPPRWSALPYTDQAGFDQMLWACDLNLVRGEDSLVRALWAGQSFVWHIYPQDDNAHHAKLDAFLDWLQAPPSLRRFHLAWNGMGCADCTWPSDSELADWASCAAQARQRLLQQTDLCSQLLALEH
jgi:uncharacterized repeat protein (TIGR03837 family)